MIPYTIPQTTTKKVVGMNPENKYGLCPVCGCGWRLELDNRNEFIIPCHVSGDWICWGSYSKEFAGCAEIPRIQQSREHLM